MDIVGWLLVFSSESVLVLCDGGEGRLEIVDVLVDDDAGLRGSSVLSSGVVCRVPFIVRRFMSN